MDRQNPDPLTEDERTNQISTASAITGTPTEGDDVIDGGFLLESVNGLGGTDLLIVDYSGSNPAGETPARVNVRLGLGTPDEVQLIADDNTIIASFDVRSFERLDATGTSGNDVIEGLDGDFADILRGGAGDDVLNGYGGNDLIEAGPGDDDIVTMNAGDTVDGGTGLDVVSILNFDNVSEAITITPGDGANLTLPDGTSLSNVERFGIILLGAGDDVIDGGFLVVNDRITGGAGTDLLKVDYSGPNPAGETPARVNVRLGLGTPDEVILIADDNSNIASFDVSSFERLDVTGTSGNDVIEGLDGDFADILRGGAGDDVLDGDNGDDTYVFGANWGNDTVTDSNASGTLVFEGFSPADITFTDVGGDRVFTDGTNTVTFRNYAAGNYAYDIEYSDAPPPATLPSISVNDITVNEDDGQAVFTVSLSEPVAFPVSVVYSTLFDTANPGGAQTDYNGVVDQTLDFAPGDTDLPVTITLIDDTIPEADESFQLLLETPTNATLANDRATATILDDDGPLPPSSTFTITPADGTFSEDAGTVTFTITRSDTSNAETVYVSTVQDRGSTNNGDYVGLLNERIDFAANDPDPKPVTVTVNDDTEANEPDETFGLIVQADPNDPIDALLASTNFTIEDNDQPPQENGTLFPIEISALPADDRSKIEESSNLILDSLLNSFELTAALTGNANRLRLFSILDTADDARFLLNVESAKALSSFDDIGRFVGNDVTGSVVAVTQALAAGYTAYKNQEDSDQILFATSRELLIGTSSGIFGTVGVSSTLAVVGAGGIGLAGAPLFVVVAVGGAAAVFGSRYLLEGAIPEDIEAFINKAISLSQQLQSSDPQTQTAEFSDVQARTAFQNNISEPSAPVNDIGWHFDADTLEVRSLRETNPLAWQETAGRLGIDDLDNPRGYQLVGDQFDEIQDDLIVGSRGNDQIFGVLGNDILFGDLGADTFGGSLSDLNGDLIVDFDALDELLVQGTRFDKNSLTVEDGSAVLRVDINKDGVPEATITLLGEFEANRFIVQPSPVAEAPETTIRYGVEPAPNQQPTAANDEVTTPFGSPVTIDVLANDSDPDGTLDPTTVTITSEPGRGTATTNADGAITYTPNAGETAEDSFTYTVADDQGAVSNEATVTVTIGDAPNLPPTAAGEIVDAAFETALVIDVLANDSDTDGSLDPATVQITGQATRGTAEVNPDGTITYTPNAGESGEDSFTYTVADDQGAVSNEATVAVTIGDAPNLPPVAENDQVNTAFETAVIIALLANDADADGVLDPGSVTITVDPTLGTAEANPDGTITYTPDAGESGEDSFTYTVEDDDGATSNEATVAVTIGTAPNQPPVAASDQVNTAFETAVIIALLANDDDPDGVLDPASVTITTDPTFGTVEVNPDGTVTYTPNAGASGDDSFAYTVADENGAVSNEATVTVSVGAAPNQSPVASADAIDTGFETAVIIDVLANDDDPDGTLDPATVQVTGQGSKGTAEANPDGTITYTPDAGESGEDSFTYTVEDDDGAVSNEATVAVTIGTAPNQPPTAANDQVNTAFETAVIIALLANDTDPDGVLDPGSVTITADPTLGSVEVNPDGTVTYTPNAGASGNDSFAYTVADENGAVSDAATVTVSVDAAPNQSPVASADAIDTGFETAVIIDVLANDDDPDGTLVPASVTVTEDPTRGTAEANPDGTVTYTPNPGETGEDGFTYTVEDDDGAVSNEATVAVNIGIAPPEPDNAIIGTARSERLFGTPDEDEIFALGGNDRVFARASDDIVHGGSGNDRVQGGFGNDELYGDAGNDRINGNAGDDLAFGGRGNDRVNGGLGDDILIGGLGNDRLAGGLGFDVAIFEGDFADFRITGRNALARGVRDLRGDEGRDTLSLVEILQFDGGFFDTRNGEFTEDAFATPEVEALVTSPGFTTDPEPSLATAAVSVAQVETLVTEVDSQQG